jgi:hypothetical protein
MKVNLERFLQMGDNLSEYLQMRVSLRFLVAAQISGNAGSNLKINQNSTSNIPAEEIQIFIRSPARRQTVAYWYTMRPLATEMISYD